MSFKINAAKKMPPTINKNPAIMKSINNSQNSMGKFLFSIVLASTCSEAFMKLNIQLKNELVGNESLRHLKNFAKTQGLKIN